MREREREKENCGQKRKLSGHFEKVVISSGRSTWRIFGRHEHKTMKERIRFINETSHLEKKINFGQTV